MAPAQLDVRGALVLVADLRTLRIPAADRDQVRAVHVAIPGGRSFSAGSNDSMRASAGGAHGLGARRLGPTLPAGIAQEGDGTSTRVRSLVATIAPGDHLRQQREHVSLRRGARAERPP